MMQLKPFIVLGLSGLLAACALTPQETRDVSSLESIQKTLDEVQQNEPPEAEPVLPPEAVSQSLMPSLLPELMADSGEERFDVFVSSVEARDFFMGLVKDTGYNMVVHPDVKGKISLELRDVSIAEVMEVVRDIYGYPYKQRDTLYQVWPGGLRSEVFQLDYLSLKRRGISEMQVSAGEVSNAGSSNTGDDSNDSSTSRNDNDSRGVIGTKVSTHTEADFWSELQQTLHVLIGGGDGRSVVVTPQAGIVVIRAFPEEMDIARDYLRKAQLIMRRQVVLEAKILEVQLNDSYQTGIDWSAIATPGSDNSIVFGVGGSSPVSPNGAGGIFSLSVDLGDFSGVLQMLETQGSVQVLSSPRISTVNNQKAVIKVGQDEFFVTDISNTTTTSTGTTTNNPDIELTPFFSGIALDVTPQISEKDEIILHIHPTISDVEDQTKTIDFGGESLELPLALSTIRETDSIVYARSGQVIVLGGLMQDKSKDSNSGTPVLGSMPLVGHLFSQQRNATTKSELVIMLKPVIMGPDGLPSQFDGSQQRFNNFRSTLQPGYRAP
jgi:MSHA biogenesis protein MshL